MTGVISPKQGAEPFTGVLTSQDGRRACVLSSEAREATSEVRFCLREEQLVTLEDSIHALTRPEAQGQVCSRPVHWTRACMIGDGDSLFLTIPLGAAIPLGVLHLRV